MLELIAGLGNPGAEYRNTRHNIGFDIVDELAYGCAARFRRSWRLPLRYAQVQLGGHRVWLIKPQTFMNRSGRAFAGMLRKRGIAQERALVVYDDVDMELGRLRLRQRGGAGGHNGLQSVIDEQGSSDFPRLRAGVGPRPQGSGLVDYVLGDWPEADHQEVENLRKKAVEALRCAATEGVETAMNRFNG